MKNKPKSMRNALLALIRETAKNASAFVRDPERDFTRKRKLDMETMILILIGMEGNSLTCELLNHFGVRPD